MKVLHCTQVFSHIGAALLKVSSCKNSFPFVKLFFSFKGKVRVNILQNLLREQSLRKIYCIYGCRNDNPHFVNFLTSFKFISLNNSMSTLSSFELSTRMIVPRIFFHF